MNKMKRRVKKLWVRHITFVNLALLIVSFIVVVLHDSAFTGNPELFEGGTKVWDLAYRLSLALIGSYIFYFVVVHLRRQQDKKNLQPFLQRQTRAIIFDAKILSLFLRNESGHNFTGDHPSLADIKTMCAAIKLGDVNGEMPSGVADRQNRENCRQYLYRCKSRTERALSRIYAMVPFLDSDYLKLLTNIEYCSYYCTLDGIVRLTPDNSSLAFLAKVLHDYFEQVQELDKHAREKLI